MPLALAEVFFELCPDLGFFFSLFASLAFAAAASALKLTTWNNRRRKNRLILLEFSMGTSLFRASVTLHTALESPSATPWGQHWASDMPELPGAGGEGGTVDRVVISSWRTLKPPFSRLACSFSPIFRPSSLRALRCHFFDI